VRDKYLELWKQGRKRFVKLWRHAPPSSRAASIDDLIAAAPADAAAVLDLMKRDGVVLDDDRGVGDDYVRLVTSDPEVAKKYDLLEESEYWGIGEAE
jgi:hypothetical protein